MSDEQKQKLRDYRREYYASKKLNKIIDDNDNDKITDDNSNDKIIDKIINKIINDVCTSYNFIDKVIDGNDNNKK